MPTEEPTEEPTKEPTPNPTKQPRTRKPTPKPTPNPTRRPRTSKPTPRPTPEPTERPTPEPTPRPTSEPTESPTQAPIIGTREPTISSSPTRNPTPRPTDVPTFQPTDDPTPNPTYKPTPSPTPLPTGSPIAAVIPAPTNSGTVKLTAIVKLELRSVPSVMNTDEQWVFEQECAAFLGSIFELATPPVFDVKCTVRGQKLILNLRRERDRRLSGGGIEGEAMHGGRTFQGGLSDAGRAMQADPGTQAPLYPIILDVRISGNFEATANYKSATDVDFKSTAWNFFNVQGNLLAKQLQTSPEALPDMIYYKEAGTVKGVRETTIVDQPENLPGDPGSNNGSSTGWLIAVIVGSVAFVALVLAMIFLLKRKR